MKDSCPKELKIMKSRDIVLFLGAGFSKDAGLPTISEFGAESTDQFYRLKSRPNEIDSTPYLTNAGDIFAKFQGYCEKAKRFVNLDTNNMEELFCIAEALNEAKIKDLSLDGEVILVKDLLVQIKIWLWKIYQQCPPLNPTKHISKETIEAYDSFIDILNNNKLTDRLTVLTTNYDLIFEYFAWKRGIRCVYPFNKKNVEPLNVFNRKDTDDYVLFEPENNGPIICKLHGSINFFNLEEQGKKSPLFGISYDVAKHGQPRVPKTPRPAIFMLNAIWELQQKMKKLNREIELAIIPPTYAKLQEHLWLQDTWNSSFQALKNATHIIFIGYSFPESDGFIRAMISGAMASRRTKTDLHVLVVNPDINALCRYQKIFPYISSPDSFVPLGFCEAWKKGELIKILSTITA
jgi:hypothetical protein